MAELKIERLDPAGYELFLNENPPDDPYSLPKVLRAYEEVFSHKIDYIGVFRNETPVAVSALFSATKFSQSIVKLMPLRVYDGVHFRNLGDSKNQKQEYERLLALQAVEEYLRRNYSFYQMVFPPGHPDIRAFQWAGAGVVPQYTYLLDLRTFSEENYTKSLREVLRAAANLGLTADRCSVSELISLNRLSYERHGRRPPVDQATLGSLLQKLDESGMLSIECVKNRNGEVVTGMASLGSARGSYFYVNGTDAQAEKGASHFLFNEILMGAKKSGLSFVDFVGANTPTINLFKSSFGPRLDTYFRVWKANSLPAKLATLVKKI